MKYNGNRFSVYESEEKTVLGLIKELGDVTNQNIDELNNKTDKKGNHEGSWQGLNKPTLSDEGLKATVEKLQEDKINSQYVEVNLNEYKEMAKQGTELEDWSPVFKHVFTNVIKNNCGKIKWSGLLVIKETINVPYGVALEGSSLPYTGLIIHSQFNGLYAITQNSVQSHIDFRNIQIDFTNNPNVRGFFIANPYDYSTLDNLVGNACNRSFLVIGNDLIGQTLRVQNICVYSTTTIYEPLMVVENLQEGYFCNNKFLSSGYCEVNLVECDGVNTTTWINNSFCNTNKRAIKYMYSKHPKRPVGNVFTANLFENIKGDFCIYFEGHNNIDFEGNNNSILSNDYMNSNGKNYLSGIANTIVIDYGFLEYSETCRRTFNINPYMHSQATNPYGHCSLVADGNELIGDYRGGFRTTTQYSFKNNSMSNESFIKWNIVDGVNYGMLFNVNGRNDMRLLDGNVEFLNSGKGLVLISPNGGSYHVTIGDDGVLKTRKL